MLAWLDDEGGKLFEMVDEELIHLQDVLVDTLHQDLKPQMTSLSKLENRILKLEKHVNHLNLDNQMGKEQKNSLKAHLQGDTI